MNVTHYSYCSTLILLNLFLMLSIGILCIGKEVRKNLTAQQHSYVVQGQYVVALIKIPDLFIKIG